MTTYVNPPGAGPSFGTTGNRNAQANFRQDNANLTDFGRSVFNDQPEATYQWLGDHFNGSTRYSNWLQNQFGDNYARWISQMAAGNNPTNTFADWLGNQHFTSDFRRLSPQERGDFRGILNPTARMVL